MDFALRAHIINCQKIGMIQCAENARFMLKALKTITVYSHNWWQNFDCNDAIKPSVPSAINLAHSTGAKRRNDFVRPELFTRVEGHRCALYPRLQPSLQGPSCPGKDRAAPFSWLVLYRHRSE